MEIEFDADKFKELLLYVANKSIDDPAFGATKLNKILFFSDFLAYGQFGKPITGAMYQRLEHGPAPRELLPVQEELQRAGDAILVERKHFNYPQKRLFPLREADLSSFSAKEVGLVDHVIDLLRRYGASEVSVLSHVVSLGWRVAEDREEIPYEAVFLSSEPPTPTDIRRGQELARQHGWLV